MLVRRAHDPYDGCWDIPGGFCDLREHPSDAAVREAREETGLEVEPTGLVGCGSTTTGRPARSA